MNVHKIVAQLAVAGIEECYQIGLFLPEIWPNVVDGAGERFNAVLCDGSSYKFPACGVSIIGFSFVAADVVFAAGSVKPYIDKADSIIIAINIHG